MQTFRKLPIEAPTTKARPTSSQPPPIAGRGIMPSDIASDEESGGMPSDIQAAKSEAGGGLAPAPRLGAAVLVPLLRAGHVGSATGRVADPRAAVGAGRRMARLDLEVRGGAGRRADHAVRKREARKRRAVTARVRVVVHEERFLS